MPQLTYIPFCDVMEDVTRLGEKLPTSEYKSIGKTQIIDQGKERIAGFTDREEGIFRDVPVVIFGDHTRIFKYLDKPFFLGADGVKILKCKHKSFNTKFLYHYFTSARLPNEGYNRHFKWVKTLSIPQYPIEIQNKISSIFDKIDELRRIRKEQIDLLDTLVKSRFVEMFGDVVKNDKNWPIKVLPEISENLDFRRIPITQSVREKGAFPYYGASGIVDYVKEYIFDEDLLLISEDGANLLARATPIAFSISGKTWVNNHAHVLRFSNMPLQLYVETLINLIEISNFCSGSAQPKLNQASLNGIPIPLPDDESLRSYHNFLRQTDKSKLALKQSLDELNTLKKALMQKFFG